MHSVGLFLEYETFGLHIVHILHMQILVPADMLMSVYEYVRMYTHNVYTRKHAHTRIYVFECTHTHIYVYCFQNVRIWDQSISRVHCTSKYTYLLTLWCQVHVYVYVCMYAYIYIYVFIYTHICTYTHKHAHPYIYMYISIGDIRTLPSWRLPDSAAHWANHRHHSRHVIQPDGTYKLMVDFLESQLATQFALQITYSTYFWEFLPGGQTIAAPMLSVKWSCISTGRVRCMASLQVGPHQSGHGGSRWVAKSRLELPKFRTRSKIRRWQRHWRTG